MHRGSRSFLIMFVYMGLLVYMGFKRVKASFPFGTSRATPLSVLVPTMAAPQCLEVCSHGGSGGGVMWMTHLI